MIHGAEEIKENSEQMLLFNSRGPDPLSSSAAADSRTSLTSNPLLSPFMQFIADKERARQQELELQMTPAPLERKESWEEMQAASP
ncbi:MAG: hypothetical protein ACKOAD_09055 [Gammaproteobacteria bacterium]